MALELDEATQSTSDVADQVRAERAEQSPRRSASGTGSGQRGKKRGTYRKAKSAAAPATEEKPERPPYQPTEQSLAASALLGATIWKLAGPMLKLDSLSAEESEELGAALDPILAKYVPLMDDWREELTLAVVLAGAFERTRARYKESHPEQFVKRNVRDVGPSTEPARDLGDAVEVRS